MVNQFVPYELAVKLKELGFDEPCIYYFNKSENNQLWQDIGSGYYRNSVVSKGNLLWGETYDNGNVSTPLWQQAFDWFREEHNLDSYIRRVTHKEWKFEINYILQNDSKEEWEKYKKFQDYKDTQKEAREACLEKLIELCKNK